MAVTNFNNRFNDLCSLVKSLDNSISFTIMEIGALPLNGEGEPFHKLLDLFPDSSVIAFEVDNDLCEKLNKEGKEGLKYYPTALGESEEEKDFYITNHSMCCSLYKPNDKLLSLYNNLEVALLKSKETIKTQSLDYFIKENSINTVDFIKIDIQGAELDVFKGGLKTLENVLGIITEVEFIPLYEDQPLFGDVTKFLSEKDFMFHKFLNLAGRSLKPIVENNNPNIGSQHMWADAIYIQDIFKISSFNPQRLLKLGLFAYLYRSVDLTYFCFSLYDKQFGTDIKKAVL